jgi:branched-chain amino acid transport system substrate-binding protein
VTRARTTQTDAVIKELEKTSMPATSGRIVFDETHDVKYGPGFVTPVMVQWQQGGERVVVWPKDKVNGKFILPPWISKK